jgi:thiol:disulfide interchange protein
MKTKFALLALGLALALEAMLEGGCSAKPKLPPIYDTQSDGAKLIADTLVIAQREHKRVLVEFGANWCIWCHRLHELLTTNPEIAPYFNAHFLLVLVDVNDRNGKPRNEAVIQQYGEPTKEGLPGLVVLETDGQQLKTQYTAEFESGDRYDNAKVLSFLKEWTSRSDAAK